MGFPSGFKPNKELDLFIGNWLLKILDYWNNFTRYATNVEPTVVVIVGCVGFFGCTFQLGITRDILTLCSTHIHFIYTAFIKTYRFMISIMGTLMQMFNGKSFNVIKQRKVSTEYSYEEVVVGSIIFTLIIFLVPTIFMFYLSFAYIYCIIMVSHVGLAVLETLAANFPTYVLVKAVVWPYDFPATISVDIDASNSLVILGSKPIGLGIIFKKMIRKLVGVVEGIHPVKLVKGFFTGESLFLVLENIVLPKQ
eukprot:TRINITY_DN8024_c0_g1_i18.p1 TRINITY_DN8024_c0_g1~~TRINITY_DN8024_c0_g1_i18.p1  ORF type:complete len:252 (+),score=33.70 TRINITY_DN8024_c0_g1_i18:273-1028(+)